jgi:anti-sigma regulatory factor (Ser/Thr protein kinase)
MSGVDSPTIRIQPGAAAGLGPGGLDLPIVEDSLHTLRRHAVTHARSLGMPGDRVGNLMVVVSELATNAIRHGGGTGRLTLWRHGPNLYCQVRDHGPGIPDPYAGSTRPDLTAINGRGLWICRQISTDLVISCLDGQPGTTVTAVMAIGRPHHSERHAYSNGDETVADAGPQPTGIRDLRQDHHTRPGRLNRPRRT